MSTTEPEIKPLEDLRVEEIWPQDTSPYELHYACLFHGTHKSRIVEIPTMRHWLGLDVQVGTTYQPVAPHCSPACGAVFLGYRRGTGPECHCFDTPGPTEA